MRYLLLCLALSLAGCYAERQPQWVCINGVVYENENGALVRVDGHRYIGHTDGSIVCVAVKP